MGQMVGFMANLNANYLLIFFWDIDLFCDLNLLDLDDCFTAFANSVDCFVVFASLKLPRNDRF
ncbi:hypothetical protein [Helicobacter sp. 23-1045]